MLKKQKECNKITKKTDVFSPTMVSVAVYHFPLFNCAKKKKEKRKQRCFLLKRSEQQEVAKELKLIHLILAK